MLFSGSIASISSIPNLVKLVEKQRILFITSLHGGKRRSTGYVQHLLRTKLNCSNVQSVVINEPSIVACQDAISICKRTATSTIIGLGGCTVADASKYIATKVDKETNVLCIPAIPCAGKEVHVESELFDWETEERICFESPLPIHCIIDPNLALEDKIGVHVDLRAFITGLITYSNQTDDDLLKSSEAIQSMKHAMTTCLAVKPDQKYLHVKQRELLMNSSKFVSGEAILAEMSLEVALANIIGSRVALPRSLLRCSLFHSCATTRSTTSTAYAEFLRTITSTSSTEQALSTISHLMRVIGIPERGLQGVISSLLDSKAQDSLNESIADWIDEASKSSRYSIHNFDSMHIAQIVSKGY
jgi:alcohol dehydrogenase class IV